MALPITQYGNMTINSKQITGILAGVSNATLTCTMSKHSVQRISVQTSKAIF